METTTARERILTALGHHMGDRLTWAPYFRTWWEAHQKAGEIPPQVQGARTYLEAFRPLGLDILDKGAPAVRVVYRDAAVVDEELDGVLKTRYITPVGEVFAIQAVTSAYDHTAYQISYEFKSMDDLPVLRYLYEHMEFEPNFTDYVEKQSSIGDSGQYMSEVLDTPLHRLFVHLMGYERACYALADYPAEMGLLLDLILDRHLEACRLAMASPAPVILTPDNTNADFETPGLFQRYALPYLKKVSELCHEHGKLHVAHMCGKLKPLLPLIKQAQLDGIESLTPPPFADTQLWEAREALPGVCIIGGVSPHLLVGNWQRFEFEEYLQHLFGRMAPGDNWILAVSDDTPCDADIVRFQWVSDFVARHGQLPLHA